MYEMYDFAWHDVPESMVRAAEYVAEEKAPLLAARKRSTEQILQNACTGQVGEVFDHAGNDTLDWWAAKCKADRGKTDDGGFDRPDGRGIKTVPLDERKKYVIVSDERAFEQIVYQYDKTNRRIRYRGFLKRSDIKDVVLPDGRRVRGVALDDLRKEPFQNGR